MNDLYAQIARGYFSAFLEGISFHEGADQDKKERENKSNDDKNKSLSDNDATKAADAAVKSPGQRVDSTTSGASEAVKSTRNREPRSVPTVVDCTVDTPENNADRNSAKIFVCENTNMSSVAVRKSNDNLTSEANVPPGQLTLRSARVVRPDGCTMRSGIDIDESSVVQR